MSWVFRLCVFLFLVNTIVLAGGVQEKHASYVTNITRNG